MGFNLSEYEPVEDRIREFWEQHPYGRITTELLAHGEGHYIVSASVFRGDETPSQGAASTGLAHEDMAVMPNNMKHSALEVCETSAIGRALANLGYAPKGKRPSREEMASKTAGVVVTPSAPAGEGSSRPVSVPPPQSVGDGPNMGKVGSAPCSHEMTTPLKPDGRPMVEGHVRCLECGYVLKGEGVT